MIKSSEGRDVETMSEESNEVPRRTYLGVDGSSILRNWANFAAGKIPIEELDDDELHREQLKDRYGSFSGRPPVAVPRTLRKAIASEISRRAILKFQTHLPEAQQVFIDVMGDSTQAAGDRLRAATYFIERIMGKVPDKVEVSAEIKPWEGLVGEIVHDIEADTLDVDSSEQ